VLDITDTENISGPVVDTSLCYVRVTGERADGLIEFEYAVGEPELFVELILPSSAFEEFCAANAVQFLSRREATAPTELVSHFAWKMSDATRVCPK